jgi:hypothetical protein
MDGVVDDGLDFAMGFGGGLDLGRDVGWCT